jgi:Papain-like cysteine protease AvrRpt2
MPLPSGLIVGSPVVPAGGLAPTTAALAPAGGAAAVAPGKGGYPFTMQTQTEDNWCWAATAVSTSRHYSSASSWTQCKLANTILSRPSGVDCCAFGSDPECDVEWYLDRALTATANLLDVRAGAIAFSDLTKLLDGDRPLGVRIEWGGGGGHFVVFHEWEKTTSGTEFVVVADPYYGGRTVPYNDCVYRYPATGALTGTWTHSYWTQP